ncbi:MAG: outer rane efflux protein [Myxococcales bacterium]|nr:outer rane efflux protein [Myxococcales bacterium]
MPRLVDRTLVDRTLVVGGVGVVVAALALVGGARRVAAAEEVERLGFADAVTRALQHNPNVTVAVEEIHRAQAIVEQTRAQSLPTLTVNGAYTRLDGDRILGANVVTPANSLSANLVLAVPLIQPRGWGQWSHARENVDVSRLSANEVRRQLAISTARTYLSIIAARRVLEVTVRARTTAEAHYQFAHQRYTSGYGSRVDEVRAAQELATDRSQVESAEAQLTRTREALGVLLGTDHAIDAADDAPALGAAPIDMGASLAEARSQRADIKLNQSRVEATHHLVRDDWLDYLPSLYATFVPFVGTPTVTLPGSGWQAQLSLSWSIYDGGLRYGLAKERRALENEARAQLEGSVRQAASEVRTADEEVRRTTTSLTAARDAAKNAADALDLTTLGYRAGATTNIEVIDAERAARDAATAVAIAEDSWRQALLALLIATGRFPV